MSDSAGIQNGAAVDTTLNPLVASVQPSKTMLLTDLAGSMRASGIDVISLAAGEPDFDTPQPVAKAGIQAIRHAYLTGDFVSGPVLGCLLCLLWV